MPGRAHEGDDDMQRRQPDRRITSDRTAPLQATRFVGGARGEWTVEHMEGVRGAPLPTVERVAILANADTMPPQESWVLRGVASYERYVTRTERAVLEANQPALGRATAACAALIPVSKTAEWWALPQDERRAVLEDRSHHIRTGVRYLPAVARRLYQSRDLGEPFDFLTWFEYAPADSAAFEELVQILRATEEWRYVEREVDIRLRRAGGPVAGADE